MYLPPATLVQPRALFPVKGRETYRPFWPPTRPGSDQHEQIPSLHDGVRYYRDGRKEPA